MKGFLADVYLRPSCYRCRCKNGVSHSDLTIGDFWGVPKVMPDFDDDKGVGIVLLNTDKGKCIFDTLDMGTRATDIAAASIFNGGFKENVKMHPKRMEFYKKVLNGKDVSSVVAQVLNVTFLMRVFRKVKRIMKH